METLVDGYGHPEGSSSYDYGGGGGAGQQGADGNGPATPSPRTLVQVVMDNRSQDSHQHFLHFHLCLHHGKLP